MKIVFLDFDGPIIPSRCFALHPGSGPDHAPDFSLSSPCATSGSLINQVLIRADAKLVISSSWREDGLNICNSIIRQAGITDISKLHVDWATPILQNLSREDEIQAWADKHGVTEFIAIDDMPLLKLEAKHRVHCTTQNGFLLEHYVEACEKLGVEPYEKSFNIWLSDYILGFNSKNQNQKRTEAHTSNSKLLRNRQCRKPTLMANYFYIWL